jgi:hypothetical protein
MKSQSKPDLAQLNLPLLDQSPAVIPVDRNDELVQALAALLLGAADSRSPVEAHPERGHDESETDR